jgi:hypothetical protein
MVPYKEQTILVFGFPPDHTFCQGHTTLMLSLQTNDSS